MRLGRFKDNLISVLIVSLLLTGCGSVGLAHDAAFESNYENSSEEPMNIFVSSAQGIVRSVDTELSIMEFYTVGSSDILSLSYDGTTMITDRYGSPMNVQMIQKGDVVNIAYNSDISKMGAIVLSPDVFCMNGVSKYSLSENGQTFYIGEDAFSVDENTKVFSMGQEIELQQLINHDTLTVQGLNHQIYSIVVDDGHGYLELDNEEAIIGGWIEVGQSVISQVMEGMLFTVPEGEYTVRLTNEGIEEYRDVVISRNEVTKLDLSDIEAAVPEKGIISFKITPETAITYIDGSFIDTRYSVRIPVGMHEMTVSDSGYATVKQYFEVTGFNQELVVDLVKESENLYTVSNNSIDRNLYATVTIEAPSDAEIYDDNIYKGITPVTYQKTAGSHTITFRKPGYVTTSYTIILNDDGLDQSFSFPDLIPEKGNDNYSSTISGNSISSGSISSNNLSTVSQNTVSGNTVSGNSADT